MAIKIMEENVSQIGIMAAKRRGINLFTTSARRKRVSRLCEVDAEEAATRNGKAAVSRKTKGVQERNQIRHKVILTSFLRASRIKDFSSFRA